MAVEMAVVAPVILLVLVIAIDMLAFAGECARFDHMASQQVLAKATSAPADENSLDARTDAIRSALEEAFAANGSSVDVSHTGSSAELSGAETFTCTLRFAPWPLSVAGAPAFLEHEWSIAVDPYIPGRLL